MVPAVPRACPAGRVIRCIRREIVRHRSRWARTGLTTRGPIPCGLRVRCLSLTIVEGHRLPVVVVRSLSVVGTKPDVNETTISPPTTHDEPVRWVVYVSLSAGLRYHRHTRSPSCFLSFLTCLSLYVKCAHIFAESATNVNKKSELMLMRRSTASVYFVRRLSWSISSIVQRKFTLRVRRSLK